MDTLTNDQIAQARLADWRKLAQALHARFEHDDARAAAAFVAAVAEALPYALPELRVTGRVVDVTVATTQDGVWVTPDDVVTARAISELAARHDLRPAPAEVTQLELALDTAREDPLGRFWSALLTGNEGNKVHDSVFDPTGRVPSLWFQQTPEVDSADPPSQRWHFDLWLAPETAPERIAAAVAAGGTVVDDEQAPSFTVLADPDGNRVCVCTSLDR